MEKIITNYVIPNEKLNGLYHVSSDPISKFDLLNLVKDVYKTKISIEPFDDFAVDRSLNSDKFQRATGYRAPAWEKMIGDMYHDFMEDYCYLENSYRKANS
jgi:dTDP-4-dehydrorhamnose reductase